MDDQRLVQSLISMMQHSANGRGRLNSGGFELALAQNEALRQKLQGLPTPQRARLLAIVEQVQALLQTGKDDVDNRHD